jgi:molybdopterin biosynthesis enzyme
LRQFLTVRLKNWDEGRGAMGEEIIAESAYKESGTITSLSDADGFIVIPEEVTHLPAGTPVAVTPLD